MTYYERNLPHWQPECKVIFLTFRLYGSLPVAVVRRLAKLRENPERQFAEADRCLDLARTGPRWMGIPEIARYVEGALQFGERAHHFYMLHAYVVMPNHVHALLEPQVPLTRVTRGIKGVSARDANATLGRTGNPFWQDESFDHWVRTPCEFERIRNYVEMNPVKAGLTRTPEVWPWSSAHK
jgi:REP element-mobilizing transposase RayT